jgi:hypothetical protein
MVREKRGKHCEPAAEFFFGSQNRKGENKETSFALRLNGRVVSIRDGVKAETGRFSFSSMSPDPHSFVFSTTSNFLPIRAPINGINLIFMPREILKLG